MKKCRILGLFGNFDDAFAAIEDFKKKKVDGITVDDVTFLSPIEHPDIDDVLGPRPSVIPKVTLCGAAFGITFGFLFLASAQSNFLIQPQGGKPIVPLPSNIVLTYEMMILFSVLFTVVAFLITTRLFRKRKSLYSEKVGIDQVAIEFEVDEKYIDPIKAVFKDNHAVEVREEVQS